MFAFPRTFFACVGLIALTACPLWAQSGPPDFERLWAELADVDAARAFKAMGQMAEMPDKTSGFLKERLKPVANENQERIKKLIEDLNSERLTTRQKANAELDKLGELAVPQMKEALAQKPSLEMSKRIENLLDKLEGPITNQELLRSLRAIEVLEWIGNAQAREVVIGLAKGARGHRVTEAAEDTIKRLQKNDPKK